MGGSLAARTNGSPKYAVPNFNKKGAHAQAKFASKLGARGAYSADAAGARTSATDAFSGETTGTGDVVGGDAGAGMGGAGISNGAGLKGNDPSLNSNKTNIPKVDDTKIEDVSPWNKILMKALYWGLGAIALIILTALLRDTPSPFWAIATCAAAIVCIGFVIAMGFKLMKGNGNPGDADYWAPQTMYGLAVLAAGAMLIKEALKALGGAKVTDTDGKESPRYKILETLNKLLGGVGK